jgi:pimeloyl-ACP methyl ester carboxylesterase
VPNLAVWTLDRRGNSLEDVSIMALGDPDLSLAYYGAPCSSGLDFCSGFTPWTGDSAPFVREWGAAVQLEDLRRVVLAARQRGRRGVILGGHSMGAVTVPTYAAWDFDGSPGYLDLEAMVLIDGGQFNAFSKVLEDTPFETPWATLADAAAALETLSTQSPFGFAGPPLPAGASLWMVGVLPELACQYALAYPSQTAMLQPMAQLMEALGLVPPNFVPQDFAITNEAFAGRLFTSGLFSALEVRAGALAQSGSPRPWLNGPFASVARVCQTFTKEPGNGLEWYYPIRLDMDLFLALASLRPTQVTEYLGLRPYHLSDINLPLYVFETSLSQGGVLRAARQLVSESRISQYQLVSDENMGHLDPLGDFPDHNSFITSVVPFLRQITSPRD